MPVLVSITAKFDDGREVWLIDPSAVGDDVLVKYKARKYQPWHTYVQWRYVTFDAAATMRYLARDGVN